MSDISWVTVGKLIAILLLVAESSAKAPLEAKLLLHIAFFLVYSLIKKILNKINAYLMES